VKRFEPALDHSSIGLSFRQTFVVIDQHKEVFGNVKLVGVNDHIVSQYVRVGVAINLQRIPNILSSPRVWSFALVADSSTHQYVSELDIRNPRLSQWFSGESAPDPSALLRLSYSKEHYCHDLSHFGCVVCMLAI
jgi:DNA-binding transcriptional regulator YdaS (Cro superfamily)